MYVVWTKSPLLHYLSIFFKLKKKKPKQHLIYYAFVILKSLHYNFAQILF